MYAASSVLALYCWSSAGRRIDPQHITHLIYNQRRYIVLQSTLTDTLVLLRHIRTQHSLWKARPPEVFNQSGTEACTVAWFQ
jgi:hypothetical protein